MDQPRHRFARISPGHGGLPRVRVASPHVEGEMYFHGGQVMSWKPAGIDNVLFVSRQARWEPGKPIRGGVPVCFPWFGPHPSNPEAPAHGFVRTKAWSLESINETDEAIVVSMFTVSDDESQRWWAPSFRLVHRVTFGQTLTMELIVTNTGDEPLGFEEALHTYYRVADIDRTRVLGLEGLRYVDTLVRPSLEKAQDGAIEFTGETDRIYLDSHQPIVVVDGAARRLTLTASQAHTAVVWNPWVAKARALQDLADDEWPQFVCVETCNVERRAVTLAAGRQHVMRVIVSADRRGSGPAG
jgi:glucose-6-phosphate 1-epimerase